MPPEQLLPYILVLAAAGGAFLKSYQNGSTISKNQQAHQEELKKSRRLIRKLETEVHTLQGRLTEQRNIYTEQITKLQQQVAELQHDLGESLNREARLLNMLRARDMIPPAPTAHPPENNQ